ncbi:MAG: substrate-binding domain-containing protein [Solirubrobacterales bacterium]|nr:substrate-binding domain-containing protein [Solirubrobacterales bacterium]
MRSRRAIMRTVAGLSLWVAVAGLATGCGQAGSQRPTHFQARKPLKIGYSVYDLKDPYWQSYANGIHAEAAKLGIGVVQADQQSSELAEVTTSQDLINQGISALIVSPVEPAALTAIEDDAHARKIPVIIGDVGAVGKYDAFVQSANTGGGALAARYLIGRLENRPGTKQIGVISLSPGNVSGVLRVNGFRGELAEHHDFRIVSTLSGNDEVEGGFTVAQDMLISHPDLAGIFAANDSEAEGAVQALAQQGRNGARNPIVVGFNGDAPALALIQQHQMAATVIQNPIGQGRTAVRAAIALLHGQRVAFTQPASRTIDFPVRLYVGGSPQGG